MTKTKAEIDASIQSKLEADTDFQATLDGLSDEEKTTKVEEKKGELFDQELAALDKEAQEAKKAKEIADNYKTRAEKAEGELKTKGGGDKAPEHTLSPKDSLLLAKANIDIEDVDEVLNFANYQKIDIKAALENTTLKAILADRVEKRQSAGAAQIKGQKGAPKVSGDALIDKARKGQIAEDDIDKLTEAEMEAKLKNR